MEKRANASSIVDFFKAREKSFLTSLENTLSYLGSDTIQRMFHNPNEANYLPTRITAIICEILNNDREKYIEHLQERLQLYENSDENIGFSSSVKSDRKRLTRQSKTIRSIKSTNNSISFTITNFTNDIKSILRNARSSVSTAINSLVHDNNQLTSRLESINRQKKSLSRDVEDLKRQLSISQGNLTRSQKQYNEISEILESKERDLNSMTNLNYNLSSTIASSANQSPSSKKRSKSQSYANNFNDDDFGFMNRDENSDLLIEYKNKLDDANQQIQNLKSQMQISDKGELMQSIVYASETIKNKDQQIQELQNHVKSLNNEIQSLGNQIQTLTAQGASPSKRVTFQEKGQNQDKFCTYDELEHVMNERNDLADQLEEIQSKSHKSEKQKKLLENKVNELLQQKSESERQLHNQILELQESNKQLSLSLKDNDRVADLLNREKGENEKKNNLIRQKDILIQSLTTENAKLIGQFTAMSKIDDQAMSKNSDLSLEILLDSSNFDPQQKKIINKLFNELQKKNDQKILKLEQALKSKIKSENELKQDIEKVNQTVDDHQKIIDQKQKQIENLSASSTILQEEKSQSQSKITELNSHIASLEAKVNQLQESLSVKQKTIDDFRPIYESFKEQKESLEAKINQIQNENSIEIKRLQALNSEISEKSLMKEKEAEKVQQTNQKLTEEIDKVQKQNNQLLLINQHSQATLNMSKSLNTKLDSYKKAHQESKKQLTILAASNQQLQNKLKAKRNQVSQQVELIEKLQKSIDSVNAEKNQLINDLQAKLKQTEEENVLLKSNLNIDNKNSFSTMSLQKQLSLNQSSLNQSSLNQSTKNDSNNQISILQSENQNLLNSIKESETENEKLNQSINELNSSLEKMQLENQKQIDENKKLQSENQQNKQENSILQDTNRKLLLENEQSKERNDKLQDTNKKLQYENEQSKEENNKLIKTNNKLQMSYQKKQEENNKLISNTKKLQLGIQRQQEENNSLASSNKKLQKSNTKQKEEIDKLQDNLKENTKLNEKQMNEITQLKKVNENNANEINKLKAEIENHLTEISKLNDVNKANMKELQTKSRQIESQESNIKELQNQVQSLTTLNSKVFKKSSRIVHISDITQIPSKLEEFNNTILKIKELLNLNKNDDVVSSIVNLLKQIQSACQNLNIRDTNDFQNASLLIAKEMEENRKFKSDYSKREQKISSILHSSYTFEAVPEILIKYQKNEQELMKVLRSQNTSSIVPEIQSLVQFESLIERNLGCSTKEEATKEVIQLKNNEKSIEKILGIEDVNKIPRKVEDLFTDIQQLKKCLIIEDFHSAIPSFIQNYTNLKKAMKNSESFEKIFSSLYETIMTSKQINKLLKSENLEQSLQVIQSMKETINKSESEIDSKLIEGENLPEKVSKLSERNKILNHAMKLLNVNDIGNVTNAVQVLLDQFNQIRGIVNNGNKGSFSKPARSLSDNNLDVIQEVANMKNQSISLCQLLDVSEDAIVPRVSELLEQLKQINSIFVESFSKSKPAFNKDIIQLINDQNRQILKICEILSTNPEKVVESVSKQNQQIRKITTIFLPNNERSYNENLVDLVNKQNQQMKKISEVFENSDNFIDEIILQNQQIKSISEIYNPSYSNNIVDDVNSDHQQIQKIKEIYPDSSNVVEDATNNFNILQKIEKKLSKENENTRSNKKNNFGDLVSQVSTLKKTIKQISKITQSSPGSVVDEVDKIYSEYQKNNQIIQKSYQIINSENPDDIFNSLDSYSSIVQILKSDQNVPQKVNEMKTIIEETSSILPQNSSDKKSKKKNIGLTEQAKQTVDQLNYLSDIINNLTQLVNSDDSESEGESSDFIYSKVEKLKKNSESSNEVLTSIQEKLNSNDLSSIEEDIDIIQEDLNVKNMLLNSVASTISSNWNPINPNDLKEMTSVNSLSNSPIKRRSTKTVNEVKISQFESIFEKFVQLKKELDSLINTNKKKNQNNDLISSLAKSIELIKDKSSTINQLTSIVNKSNNEFEEEEEDSDENPNVDNSPAMIQKVSVLVDTFNKICNILEFHGKESDLVKQIQELVDRLNMNEATFSLQTCEFQTLSSKIDMNEGFLGKLCQITNTGDTNSLIRRVIELERENRGLQQIFNSNDIINQTKSICLILNSISHIIDVDKSKLPDEIQRLVAENERLSECTKQIDSLLINEVDQSQFQFQSQNQSQFQSQYQSQSFILKDKLKLMPIKIQQILKERDLLKYNVEQVKEAIKEPEEFIEKAQNLFLRENKIEQILNIEPSNNSSEGLNEIVPGMVSKLMEFHENVIDLIKPQNKEKAIEEIKELIDDNEERKRIMENITQVFTHENNDRTEDLDDFDIENETQSVDLVNEVQNLHDTNNELKRYIEDLSSIVELNQKKKSKKAKLNNSANKNLTMNVKNKPQLNSISFSPIRPKQAAQSMIPLAKPNKSISQNENLIQTVGEMKERENQIIEIIGAKYKDNFVEQINQMQNALNSIHELIFDTNFEEEEDESNESINLISIQSENDENIETYDSYINKIKENLSKISQMKAELEYIQKTTNNDSNYIQKVGHVFDQMRQIKKTLNSENDKNIPQIVSNLVKMRDSINQILVTSKQMVSTEAIDRSQSYIQNRSANKTVSISTQTIEFIQETSPLEYDLPSRVQEIVDLKSNLQEQLGEICSIFPNSEDVISEIRSIKENQDSLKKIFKSDNLIKSATELVETKQSIESIINDKNDIVSNISQLVSENEQRKQNEEKIQEILKCNSDFPAVVEQYANTVNSISQIIFDNNENEINHSNLVNEVQNIFNSHNKMKKDLSDLSSIMDSSDDDNKELIKATKELKKRENELKSILRTENVVSKTNSLAKTVKEIHNRLAKYEAKRDRDNQNPLFSAEIEEEEEDGDDSFEIDYKDLASKVDKNLTELLNSQQTISKIQKVTNEPENYEEKIGNVMSLQKKIESILSNAEYLPFSPITMKNTPAAIEYLVETQNEVCEILATLQFDDQNLNFSKSSKSTATTDIKKKEQKVTQISSKVQILADKSRILDSINQDYISEDGINNIPEKVSSLFNNSKLLISIGNSLNSKKPSQTVEKVTNMQEQMNQLKQMLNSDNVIKSVDSIQKENDQLKEGNQKISQILTSFNESNSNNDQVSPENLAEEIQTLIKTVAELNNEKAAIVKMVNNENPIEEIEALLDLKDKLQQLLPRKGIVPEVQKLIQVSQSAQKAIKLLSCQSHEFIPEKVAELKEQLKKLEEETEVMNDLLKSNSMPTSIGKVKDITSLLHDPDDLSEEITNLVETSKKLQEKLSNRETQERATINDLQTSLLQVMRVTDKKSVSEAIHQVEESEEVVKKLQKVLQVSEVAKITPKVDTLLTERSKVFMNIDASYINRDATTPNSKKNESNMTEFDFGFDNSSDDNSNSSNNPALLYLEGDQLPQCVFNMKRAIRENEGILKQITEIVKLDLSKSSNPSDFSQLPRVIAEICQSSQLIKSIHAILVDQDISDQMPETIQKLIQDSAELSVLSKESEEVKRNYEDTCNFVKRLLSIIMEGHLPQKVKFPVPPKAKEKLLEFLKSFKKRSDRNAADIKSVLKRASANGYYDNDLSEAVNSIVEESIAYEKQKNNEELHEKTKSLKQIIEKQNDQYKLMIDENKKVVQDYKEKIESTQLLASQKESKLFEESQKKSEKLNEVSMMLDKEKRIHEELIRFISRQSVDNDFLSVNLPVNEMRILFQYKK